MSNEQSVWEDFKLYRYDPSLAGNIIFVVLFSAVTVWHIVILARTRTWYFIPFVVGCACALKPSGILIPEPAVTC